MCTPMVPASERQLNATIPLWYSPFLPRPSLSPFGLLCDLALSIGQVDKIVHREIPEGGCSRVFICIFYCRVNSFIENLKISDFIFTEL